jgi:hypothetical protein
MSVNKIVAAIALVGISFSTSVNAATINNAARPDNCMINGTPTICKKASVPTYIAATINADPADCRAVGGQPIVNKEGKSTLCKLPG